MTHTWVTEETVKETWLMRLQSAAVEQSLLHGLWEERSVFINPRRACAARVTVLGLSVCPSVRLSVRYHFFATTRNEVAKKQYKRVQCYTGLIFKMAIFQKRLRSGDMA